MMKPTKVDGDYPIVCTVGFLFATAIRYVELLWSRVFYAKINSIIGVTQDAGVALKRIS